MSSGGRATAPRLLDVAVIVVFSLPAVVCARHRFALPAEVEAVYTGLMRQVGVMLPNMPVPVTGLTFAVPPARLVLGSRCGGVATLAYLGYGLAGPGGFAFALSASIPRRAPGVPVILGATAGDRFSYPLAGFTAGLLVEQGRDRCVWHAEPAMLVGSALTYAMELPRLAIYAGWSRVLALGLYPFPVDDLRKLVAAPAQLAATCHAPRLLHLGAACPGAPE